MKSYTKMSIPELEAEVNRIDQLMNDLRDDKRAAAKALDNKIVTEAALRKVANMSVAERDAIAQVLRPEGVQSDERFGFFRRLFTRKEHG